MSNVRISDLLPKRNISLIWSYLGINLVLSALLLSLIVRAFRKLLHLIFGIYIESVSIFYMFLFFTIIWVSSMYLKFIGEQLSKSGKKVFSLTSSYMRKNITLKKFIWFVCMFCLFYIFLNLYLFY